MTRHQLERRVATLEKTLADTRKYLIETRAVLLEHMQANNEQRRLIAGDAASTDPAPARTNLVRLTEAVSGIIGTDPGTAQWLASQLLSTVETMRRESGVTDDNTGDYPPCYGPWSVEPTALAAWQTYRELKGE